MNTEIGVSEKILNWINAKTHRENLEEKTTKEVATNFNLTTNAAYKICGELAKKGLITKLDPVNGQKFDCCGWIRNEDPLEEQMKDSNITSSYKSERVENALNVMNEISNCSHASSVIESRIKAMETPRAKYTYRSGNVLLLPKQGNAPMLFLEFIRDYRLERIKSGSKYPDVKFNVHSNCDENEEEYFYIRMESETRSTFADAVSYINENL
jgi:hypothetical protein